MLIIFYIVVALHDLLFRRVPNWLLIAAMFVHIVWFVIHDSGFKGITAQESLIGGLIAFALLVPLYALRAMGAGDVKFFATLGFIMGPSYLVPLWLIGSVLAGMHALLWYLSKTPLAMASATWMRIRNEVSSSPMYQKILEKRAGRRGIPYAAYLAIGAIAIGLT